MKVFEAGLEAKGFIAFGQFATGVFAIGQVATGVVAVGQLARGLVSVGQVSIGVIAFGQVAIGLVYGAGMLGIGSISGGLVPLPALGRWPLSAVLRDRTKFEVVSQHPGRFALFALVAAVVFFLALLPVGHILSSAFSGPTPRR
jgi:hypothetical protein